MDERDREPKAGYSSYSPCVYLPFLKGISVDKEKVLEYT